MQATVEAVEDEGDLGVHEGNVAVWANGGSWEWEEKQRFWEKEEQGCVREERRKRRRFIAGERQTHPARDGVNSANAASCPSLANLTGCLLPLRSKRADTNCKPRVANREDLSGLQTTEVHAVMMETEPGTQPPRTLRKKYSAGRGDIQLNVALLITDEISTTTLQTGS